MKQKTTVNQPDLNHASNFYSKDGFWKKVTRFAKKIGAEALEKLLILYYCYQDSETPKKEKSIIIAALGYFLMPIDAIPDILPGGYVDDLGVLALAITKITSSIKDEHIALAKQKLNKLLYKE